MSKIFGAWHDRGCISSNKISTQIWETRKEPISYLEVEDDGPDEAEGELRIAVDDVLTADVDQLDLLVPQEPQRGLHVLDGVEPHPTSLPRLKIGKLESNLKCRGLEFNLLLRGLESSPNMAGTQGQPGLCPHTSLTRQI